MHDTMVIDPSPRSDFVPTNSRRSGGTKTIGRVCLAMSQRQIRRWICLPLLAALLAAVVASAAETNSPAASVAVRAEKARSETKIDDRLNALDQLGKNLSLAEISEAIQMAGDLKELRERAVFSEAVLKRWGDLAPAEAFARISQMPDTLIKVNSLRSVVPAYGRKDIQAAVRAAGKMQPGRSRDEVVRMLADVWAGKDARAAIQWVNGLPEGFPKEAALRNIYFIWVHLDPAAVAPIVLDLPPGSTRTALMINVAGDWASKNPAEAVKWAEALAVEEDRQLALATVGESWADVAPPAACAFALKLSPLDLRQRTVLAAIERWATQEPEPALEWTTNILDTALRQQCIARILNVFVPVDPEAAGRWVERMPSGPVRESTIGCYVDVVRLWKPELGARLGLKTEDPSERENRVRPCFLQWIAWDPSAARAWIKDAPIADQTKTRWLSEKPEPVF